MKKKTDEIFKTLKSSIIKPFKDIVNSVKDTFTHITATWNDRIQVPLIASSESVLTFVKTMTDHEQILSILEKTRIQQLNKEHKST